MSNKRISLFGYASSIHTRKWVRSLTERGYEIRLISLGGEPVNDIDSVIIPRKGKLSYFRSYKTAVKYAIDFNPAIIHSHYAGGYGFWGMLTARHPFILSVWGSDINELPRNLFNKYLIRKIVSKADYITATSQALLNATIKLNRTVISKSAVIPFGVNIIDRESDSWLPTRSALFIKHLEKVYAPDVLIKATAIVIAKHPEFTLTIAGKGSMRETLQNQILKLGLEKSIRLVGNVPHKDIYELIKKHDFIVMPSIEEGFGVAAVEAFACCRPVVATNVGGIPEIVSDNHNGYLIEPNNVETLADAMIRMLADKKKLIQMGQNGYDIAKEKYDWEKSVDRMVDLYQSL